MSMIVSCKKSDDQIHFCFFATHVVWYWFRLTVFLLYPVCNIDQSSANLRFSTFHFSPKPLWHEPLFIEICWFLTPFIPGPLGIIGIQTVKNNYSTTRNWLSPNLPETEASRTFACLEEVPTFKHIETNISFKGLFQMSNSGIIEIILKIISKSRLIHPTSTANRTETCHYPNWSPNM